MKKKLTYISLFSSGGIGCYGFKKENFECVATVEIIKRRLEIQVVNNKCKYETGYICDDITLEKTKRKIFDEINLWKLNHNIKNIDVLIATPPCQGMSTANSKKNEKDIIRNSLVVDSVRLVDKILPNFFIFENVPAFMKTKCIASDKEYKIGEYIYDKLSKNYSIYHDVINFKNYGIPSSRKRCLVIGVKNDLAKYVSPLELFPDFQDKETTIRDTIFNFKRLKNMGEIDENDIFHFFRSYDSKMRKWISNLKEGESAYQNKDIDKRPHTISKDGNIKLNENKMGGKYKRQSWDSVAPCIHTRNDQLASQNTIHPEDDRVFSIRELMRFMSVDDDFKWSKIPESELNKLPLKEKENFLKKNELNIRQILGEAVPTKIFKSIAHKIKNLSLNDDFEKNNPNREKHGAFYTDKFIVTEIVKNLPKFSEKKSLRILEPSVGLGSFIPLLFKKYQDKKIELDVLDIDSKTLNQFKKNFKNSFFYEKIKIKKIDFFDFKSQKKYDLVIGNPPFIKILKNQKEKFKKEFKNEFDKNFGPNVITYFILKSLKISNYVCFVLPKNFLISPQYDLIRDFLSKFKIDFILDFENKGFEGVVLETIALSFYCSKTNKFNEITVINTVQQKKYSQNQNYIISDNFPNWIIYRNSEFDEIAKCMEFNIFSVFRDRQITNKFLTNKKTSIKVLRSRNVSSDGKIIDVINYDKYLKDNIDYSLFSSSKYYDDECSYLCPNFTTNIRIVKKPKKILVNGSLAIFKLKDESFTNKINLDWYSSKKFIEFYRCSNNYQKNTINLDKNSVFYFGYYEKNDKKYS